jgi:hypothetical protein
MAGRAVSNILGMRTGALIILLSASTAFAQPVPAASPMDAIPGILDLFKEYQVVGLGEGPHGNLEGHAFRLKLVRDPRFPTVVNDILVESGTGRYQDLINRYIRGEQVSRQELRRAWEDTTNPGTNWDKPMYEEFFTAVRSVNAALPKDKQLRVLLGDPPIAWEFVRTRSDLRRWNMARDPHADAVLKRESLSKNRKALVIYGDGHFQGRGFQADSLTNLIERGGTRMVTISTQYGGLIKIQPSVASWKTPSFAMIRDTTIGRKFYAQFYPMPPAPGWNSALMQDQFDAVLYLGPKPPTMTLIPRSLCLDAAYMKMRLARLNTVAPASSQSLTKLCADLTR